MIIGVIFAVILLITLNIVSMFWNPNPDVYITRNDVRGMDIQYKNTLYTLNFAQQNEVIDILNQGVLVAPEVSKNEKKPDFEKLILYRFDKSDIEIVPFNIDNDNNYTFSVSDFSKTKNLKDTSRGTLQELLLETYDH